MTLTSARTASRHGLSGTIAWTDRSGTADALEGNITVSAQAAAFMAGLLGVPGAAALSALAQTVPDAGGVTFVPTLAGLGSQDWNDVARGTITGMTHATTPAHLARANFEAIAHQVADVFQAIQAAGGASGNRFLMQLQADLAGCPARASRIEEVGAFRAAAMVMAALGGSKVFPTDSTELAGPGSSIATRQLARKAWERALRQAMDR